MLNRRRQISFALDIPSDFSDSEDFNGTGSYIAIMNAIIGQKPDQSQLDGCPLFYEENRILPTNSFSKDDSFLPDWKRKSHKTDLSVFKNSFDDFMIKAHAERCLEMQNESTTQGKEDSFNASYFFQNISEAPEQDFFEESVQELTTVDVLDLSE